MLSEDRLDIPWGHLRSRKHRVTDEEIRAVLLDGVYEYHDAREGRFVARAQLGAKGPAFMVFFEVRGTGMSERLHVATAFSRSPSFSRKRGRRP